ncbi:PREDICTED: uncharacterized protein LOC104585793 isoform X2 [Nelumbo nucifera]|uniref:Uncharacterized protein n=2 Tax=Nelumbo nucifera TaxID=4432 RepID=A0A822XGG4_NELNU|nr:PREDICTED: uncharacterized protein LOC104585793 isoform X2 [Nelumbo nucifera]DAD18106.1 TPA_asm: hypothetical protein HUJ06_019569 [Nelumbo nucifera]
MLALQNNFSFTILSSISSHSLSARRFNNDNAAPRVARPALRFQEIPIESLELQAMSDKTSSSKGEDKTTQTDTEHGVRNAKGGEEEFKGISGIRVPRRGYISVSKSKLLDAVLSMFDSKQDVDDFVRLSSCLDSILHAEHKSILEEMRIDYCLIHSIESNESTCESLARLEEEFVANGDYSESAYNSRYGVVPEKCMPFNYGLDLGSLLSSSFKNLRRISTGGSRVPLAARFQRTFMKLLHDGQFEELSKTDLLLASALNTDYLLTLPIYIDWKRASESNAIIFRRGYTTEKQKGLLLVEKLDYLQSKLLQGIFFSLSKPLGKVGMWINEALKNGTQAQQFKAWIEKLNLWMKELFFSRWSYSYDGKSIPDNQLGADQPSDNDLPIWLAAQRAVPRYEGLLSSIGPRERLLRKLLMWIGMIPSIPETSIELEMDSTTSEPYLRPIFLSRISLSDIWKPATREPCGNDIWEMLKNAVSILFSQSVLQEPAFQELILLYTEDMHQHDKAEASSLQLKIYEKIPIPDLPVIFPHKKLSFRILDSVRLDVATILGLLAYFVNYKFEDILSSPSAFLLDVIAISTLIIYIIRVALGYKQTWDRYQLLVNKTLNEKTLASGFGSIHFLLDASEQQQYKEAILAYAVLLQANEDEVLCRKSIGSSCEMFLYDKFKEKVEMPVDKALDTLLRLGLVVEVLSNGSPRLHALSCFEACKALKKRWDSLLM